MTEAGWWQLLQIECKASAAYNWPQFDQIQIQIQIQYNINTDKIGGRVVRYIKYKKHRINSENKQFFSNILNKKISLKSILVLGTKAVFFWELVCWKARAMYASARAYSEQWWATSPNLFSGGKIASVGVVLVGTPLYGLSWTTLVHWC